MGFSLNFVWINAVRTMQRDIGSLSCPIPALYQENVSRIRRAMPDLPITIWMDVWGPEKNSPELIAAIGAKSNIPDVVFRSLDEVPAFLTHPVFKKQSVDLDRPYDPLWQQVDLARLIVVEHVLVSNDFDATLYSDFNRDITPETIKDAVTKLSTHGVAVGDGLASSDDFEFSYGSRYPNDFRVENQFFGFAKTQLPFFREDVVRQASHQIHHGLNGWEGFSDAFRFHALEFYGLEINDIAMTVPKIEGANTAKRDYPNPADSMP